jgi:hypothetical protein
MTTDTVKDETPFTDIEFAVQYQGEGYFTVPHRVELQVWTIELLDAKHECTDIKWEVWKDNGKFYTPWGEGHKEWLTLSAAFQEAFLRLLQYCGLDENANVSAGDPDHLKYN